MVSMRCAGYDRVDLHAARALDMLVATPRGTGPQDTAAACCGGGVIPGRYFRALASTLDFDGTCDVFQTMSGMPSRHCGRSGNIPSTVAPPTRPIGPSALAGGAGCLTGPHPPPVLPTPASVPRGVGPTRVPEYSPFAVAEHAIGLAMALNRRLCRAYNRTREHDFKLEPGAPTDPTGRWAPGTAGDGGGLAPRRGGEGWGFGGDPPGDERQVADLAAKSPVYATKEYFLFPCREVPTEPTHPSLSAPVVPGDSQATGTPRPGLLGMDLNGRTRGSSGRDLAAASCRSSPGMWWRGVWGGGGEGLR